MKSCLLVCSYILTKIHLNVFEKVVKMCLYKTSLWNKVKDLHIIFNFNSRFYLFVAPLLRIVFIIISAITFLVKIFCLCVINQ